MRTHVTFRHPAEFVFPQMLAVTVRSNLRGTWQPMPVHANAGDTIHFLTRLDGAFPNLGQGNVAVTEHRPTSSRQRSSRAPSRSRPGNDGR
jgi:hypothetical protein